MDTGKHGSGQTGKDQLFFLSGFDLRLSVANSLLLPHVGVGDGDVGGLAKGLDDYPGRGGIGEPEII